LLSWLIEPLNWPITASSRCAERISFIFTDLTCGDQSISSSCLLRSDTSDTPTRVKAWLTLLEHFFVISQRTDPADKILRVIHLLR
jgi:hypothetical protein